MSPASDASTATQKATTVPGVNLLFLLGISRKPRGTGFWLRNSPRWCGIVRSRGNSGPARKYPPDFRSQGRRSHGAEAGATGTSLAESAAEGKCP
jgi:hypothetical protein